QTAGVLSPDRPKRAAAYLREAGHRKREFRRGEEKSRRPDRRTGEVAEAVEGTPRSATFQPCHGNGRRKRNGIDRGGAESVRENWPSQRFVGKGAGSSHGAGAGHEECWEGIRHDVRERPRRRDQENSAGHGGSQREARRDGQRRKERRSDRNSADRRGRPSPNSCG